jgi:hypothetical protein
MAKLAPGSQVYGADFPPSQYDQDWTAIANITSTTYTASGGPVVAVSVTAPTSGKVLVCIGAGVRNNASPATNERAVVTYRVLEDGPNGPVFTSESAYRGIVSCGIVAAQEYTYTGQFSLETGLTPGRQYYFQVMHRSTNGAGTADIASRDITVIPVP